MSRITANALGPIHRAGLVLALLAFSCVSLAQGKFAINGRLKVEGAGLDGCRMVVLKDGQKHRTITSDLNRFSLELELNSSYILSFEKDGFVTKKLSFDTKVPSGAAPTGFTPFDFVVSLFKQYDGVNTVVFNQPVGIIRYDQNLGDFDYDTDYTKSIQSALEAAQAAVDQKQKEESRQQAEEQKRKEQEAKAQAKQQAKLAKEETAQAKARQKQEAAQQQAAALPPGPPAPPPAPTPDPPKPAAPKNEQTASAPRVPAAKPAVVKSAAPGMNPTTLAMPHMGNDTRPPSAPRTGLDANNAQAAVPRTASEPRPKFDQPPVHVVRHKDVIVQPDQVITIVRVEREGMMNEYRRVSRKYSGVFYFKDGASCSQLTYEQEALAEN